MKNTSKPGRPLSVSANPLPKERTESEALMLWGIKAEMQLKKAMQARGWGYQELSEALRMEGIKRSATVINRRINRGNFSAAFFLVCLCVLERERGAEKEEAEAPESPGRA